MTANVDPTQTRLVKEYKHPRPLVACRFDPSGRFVVTGAQDKQVVRWDLESGQATPLEGHESWVRALAFSPDGRRLFSGGYDGRLITWNDFDATPAAARTIEAHQGWIRAVAVSPDGALVASAGNDRVIKLWQADDGTLVRELPGHADHVYALAFHPRWQSLVSGDLKGVIKQWNVHNGTLARELSAAALHKYDEGFGAWIGGTRGMAFNGDGSRLAASGIANVQNAFAGVGQPKVVELDWNSGKELKQHGLKETANAVAWNVRYLPDGRLLAGAGGGAGGMLVFWQPDSEQEAFKFKLPSTLHDLDLHAASLRVATAHPDGQLRTWDITARS